MVPFLFIVLSQAYPILPQKTIVNILRFLLRSLCLPLNYNMYLFLLTLRLPTYVKRRVFSWINVQRERT